MFFFGQRASDAGAANGAAVVPVQVTAATASSVGDVVVVVVVVVVVGPAGSPASREPAAERRKSRTRPFVISFFCSQISFSPL